MSKADYESPVTESLIVKQQQQHDSDDETVLSDESFYDPNTQPETPVVYTGIIGFFQDAFKAGSIKGGIFTLICSTLGKGMLMLPNAMSYSGLVWSTIQVVACAIIAYYSLSILTKCAAAYKAFSYQKLAEVTFGNWYKQVANVAFFLTYWSAALAILVLIAQFAQTIVQVFSGNPLAEEGSRVPYLLVIGVVFVYPLCLAKELKSLRFAYILSFLFMVLVTLAVFYESFVFSDITENFEKAKLFKLEGASSTFCTALFAYSCHPSCLDIFKELYNPSQRRIEKVIRRGLMITLGAYLLIGVFGYITFAAVLDNLNEHGGGVILFAYGFDKLGKKQNLPLVIFVVIILEGISLIILEPLTIKPAKDSLQNMIFGKKGGKISTVKHVFLVTVTVFSIILVSFVISDLAALVNVIGASLFSLICFIMPASFYLKLKKNEKMNLDKFLCWAMLIGSAVFGVYATIINFIEMIEDAQKH